MLQKAMEEDKAKTAGGGWFGAGAKAELQRTRESLAVIQEELDTKIKENGSFKKQNKTKQTSIGTHLTAPFWFFCFCFFVFLGAVESLHIKMFEERKEQKATIEILADKLEKVKAAMKKKAEELEDFSSQHKHTVGKLTTEKDALGARVEELSDTLIRTKNLMQQREHAITTMQQKFTADLDQAQQVIMEKVPFHDTSNRKYNQFNLPAFDRPMKVRVWRHNKKQKTKKTKKKPKTKNKIKQQTRPY